MTDFTDILFLFYLSCYHSLGVLSYSEKSQRSGHYYYLRFTDEFENNRG